MSDEKSSPGDGRVIRFVKIDGKFGIQVGDDIVVDWGVACDAPVMLEELRALEWSGTDMAHGESRTTCPDCGAVEGVPAVRFYRTHAPGCNLGALLDKHGRGP